MNSSKFRFTLDLHSIQSQYSIPVMLGDTGVTLLISITDGGIPYVITDGCLAKLSIKRPTGTNIQEFCKIKNNAIIEYPFSQNENTCAVAGIHHCDVTLYSPDGEKVGGPSFTMVVSETVVKRDDIVLPDDDDYAVLETMITKEAERQQAEKDRVIAENARTDAETDRKTAEKIRSNNETARIANEDARIAKDSERDAKIAAAERKSDNAIAVSNSARDDASDAKIRATAAKEQSDVTRKNLINLSAQVQGVSRSYVVPTLSNFIDFLNSAYTITLMEDRDGDGVNETYTVSVSDLKSGDNILVTEKGVPDFWFERNAGAEIDIYVNPHDGQEYLLGGHDDGAFIGTAHILETDYSVIEGYATSAAAEAANALAHRKQASSAAYRAETWANASEISSNIAHNKATEADAAAQRAEEAANRVKDGTTFTPNISKSGGESILSWTNNGGLPNPDPVNITGANGKTPYIQDGYWYIDGVNTNVKAQGEDGKTPYIQSGYWFINGVNTNVKAQGLDGKGIKSFERTSGNGAPGTTDTYTITYTDNTKSTFTVTNGADGKDGTDGKDAIKTMFISPNGNDSNSGLTADTPKKTVKACVNAGATRISAKRGVYNEIIQLWSVGDLEIFPTDNDKTYAIGEEREPIVFDTSDSIAVSSFVAYNSIKRVTYSNAANTQFDKVFTKQSQPPIVNDYGSRYNATVWLLSDDEKTVCIKLKPVLTIAECEAAANTFTYVNEYIYINANWANVNKVVVPTNWETGFYINGADKIVLKEVEVRFSGTYNIDLRNCAFFDLYKCSCKYTSYASGFHPFNSNGRMTACYATKNFDGYGISGYGHTTYIDCVSEFNFDDGMSHHDGTEGTIIGGRYEGNGKGGITPSYGASVNIYGGIFKDNASFGIGYLYSSGLEPASGIVQGAVMVGNPIGLSVNAECNVTAINCIYKDNTTDKSIIGTLNEYGTDCVKSINGAFPDENGNIELEGVEVKPPFTNLLPLAEDASGAVYNGVGYKNGYRLNSSCIEKEQSGCGHTGFIPVTSGGVLRFKNIPACTVGYGYIHYFKIDKVTPTHSPLNIVANTFTTDENGVSSYTLPSNEIAYIRFSYGEMSADSIITINEEII